MKESNNSGGGVCARGGHVNPPPPRREARVCFSQDTVVRARYLATRPLDGAPGERAVGMTRDGAGHGLPVFIISSENSHF